MEATIKVIHSNRRKRWYLELQNVTRANELPFQLTLQVSNFKSIIQTCLLHPTDTNLIPFQNFSFITNNIKSGLQHSDIEGVQLTHSVCLLHILARYSHMMDSDGNFIRPSHAMVQLVNTFSPSLIPLCSPLPDGASQQVPGCLAWWLGYNNNNNNNNNFI